MGDGQLSTPDKASEHVKVTVALVALIKPLLPGVGETAAVMTGGVLSIFKVIGAVALLPAESVTVPEKLCFAPSVLTVCDAGQLVMGATAGLH
jgi:hypothetical protein